MSESGPNPYQTPSVVEVPTGANALAEQHPLLDGRLSVAALGMKLAYFGIVLLLLSWIAIIPFGIVMATTVSSDLFELVIQWGYIGVSMLAVGMISLGPFLCLAVPAGYGLRPFAVATAIGIVLFWAGSVLQATLGGFPVMATGLTAILMFATCTLFLAYLYRVCRAIDRDDLARRCRNVFLIGGVLLVAGIAGNLSSLSMFGNGLEIVATIVFILGCLLLFVAYANAINATANAIRNPGMSAKRFSIV